MKLTAALDQQMWSFSDCVLMGWMGRAVLEIKEPEAKSASSFQRQKLLSGVVALFCVQVPRRAFSGMVSQEMGRCVSTEVLGWAALPSEGELSHSR